MGGSPTPILIIDQNESRRHRQEGVVVEDNAVSLSLALRVLFALNGLTLSLEGLGLLYVINSKVEVPIAYLPTYGAIAFLPYSFKPLYGYLSQGRCHRCNLFIGLSFLNGFSILSTCFIPKGGVFQAFLVAFLRGVTDSWAELCLGLTLIDHAQNSSHNPQCSYEGLASKFQAQAATSRNLGSFASCAITFGVFAGRQLLSSARSELSSLDAKALLVTAGILQILGAIMSFFFRSEFQAPSRPIAEGFQLIAQSDTNSSSEAGIPREGSALRDDGDSHSCYSSHEGSIDEQSASLVEATYPGGNRSRWGTTLIVLLQVTMLVLALKGPITEFSSHLLWKVLLGSCLLTTVLVGLTSWFQNWWYSSHRVGLYLILKHFIPSDSIILGSFYYSLFQASPAELQLLSLVGAGVTTFSSWAYGVLLSRYNTGSRFLILIAGTTVLAAVASLGNIVVFKHSQSHYRIWIALVVNTLSRFFDEWEFLPDVVLATTALNERVEESSQTGLPFLQVPFPQADHYPRGDTNCAAVKYGTLISCIDFGDQLGTLVTGPLVALLGISRENNFERLDQLIIICQVLNIMSLGLLVLLRKL